MAACDEAEREKWKERQSTHDKMPKIERTLLVECCVHTEVHFHVGVSGSWEVQTSCSL
jgi:hypothetical protein